MLIFFFASALSALHLYNETKFMVIGNPAILEQSHAHNAPDLWDRGSMKNQSINQSIDQNKQTNMPFIFALVQAVRGSPSLRCA